MSEVAQRLKSELAGLSYEDREDIFGFLYDSLHDGAPGISEDDPGFAEEIERRVAEIHSGRAKGTPAEEVTRALREKYS